MSCDKYYRVRADVDLNAIRFNIEKIRSQLNKNTKVCAVIKADAYGHGAVKVVHAVTELVDFYAVATMEEAMQLREAGIKKPVLILGYVHPSYAETAAMNDIRLTVFDVQTARQLAEKAKECKEKVCVHIKIDTGMSRIGFAPCEDSIPEIRKIYDMPGLYTEGIFTHFARADEETDEDVRRQLMLFRDFTDRLSEEGMNFPIKHCSNSAAATLLRDADMDMVRLGISMYGLYPSEFVHQITLEPALSLISHVVMVKKVGKNTADGYGGTWKAQKDSLIATVPVGYADGYHRLLSNRGAVLINGRRYPVIGRVCMDQIMVDVTDQEVSEPVKCGDEVVLIGRSGSLQISAEEVAELAQTINYEITCSLSRRVPRRYL